MSQPARSPTIDVHEAAATPARGPGRAAAARRPRGERVRRGPGTRRGPRPDVPVHDAASASCPTDRPLMVVCHSAAGPPRSPATWPGRANGRRQRRRRDGRLGACGPAGPARAGGGRAKGKCRAADPPGLPTGGASPGRRPGRGCSRVRSLWANAIADQDQDDEVDRPDAGRVEIAELLADLALDLHARARSRRPGRAGRTGSCGAVFARMLDARTGRRRSRRR